MAIRVSGLVSGLDTDSIVQELVAAYSTKKDKHVKAQTKLEWKMDAWKELNKKVNSLYKRLGNMKLSSYYNKKTTTISDSTKATVTASNNAINGSQTLKVLDVASTGYITGANVKDTNGKGATATTTLKQLGLADGAKGTIAVKTKNGTTNIEISSDMRITDVVNKLKDAGVSANFDSTYNRMYISARDSGAENDFALTATDANGLDALRKLGVYVKSDANDKAYAAWDKYGKDASGNPLSDADIKNNIKQILETIDKYQGDGTDSIKNLESENATIRTNISNMQADLSYVNNFATLKDGLAAEDDSGNKKLTAAEQAEMEELLKKTDADIQAEGKISRFNTLKEKLGYSDEDFAKLRSSATAVDSFEKEAENNGVVTAIHGAYNVNNDTADLQPWINTTEANINTESAKMNANAEKIAEKQAYINDNALLTSSAPAATLTEEQLKNMSAADITTFKANDIASRTDRLFEQYKNVQQIKNDNSNYSDSATDGTQAKRVNGTDARIELNGVVYQSSSNNITVNGLTVTALQKTDPGETLTITTQADAQGMYKGIKEFLKEYNALIKEMDELYNADSAKGYEPLTDDEKDAMSDKEIERWEEKIKGSILRRDDTLSMVMNLMTSTMSQGFTLSDGKRYSLSSFGIKTQGYYAAADNEGSLYHIDGDSEDEVSAGNSDRLLAAIQQDPDMVQEFFQKLSDDLYTKLDKKMQSTTMHSRYSIYNDKQMKRDYDNYTKTIKKWEDKVTAMEDYYYKKFTAMEKALSSLQSSTSALSGLLGS